MVHRDGRGAEERGKIMQVLESRFAQHPERHPGVDWDNVRARLEVQPGKLRVLQGMENTGGEPDVVDVDERTGGLVFFDCSPESPIGRRNLCFDDAALAARKRNKPRGSAMGEAERLGIELLTEGQYALLQSRGEFDQKTSSWLATPEDVRQRGGALFGDRRFGRTFVYHNGAESYYAVRGFRGCLCV